MDGREGEGETERSERLQHIELLKKVKCYAAELISASVKLMRDDVVLFIGVCWAGDGEHPDRGEPCGPGPAGGAAGAGHRAGG
jgi:hypothetical protein